MTQHILVPAALALMLGLCCGGSGEQPADLVLTGGNIFTGNHDNMFAGAVAVRGNRICAVGDAGRIAELIDPERTRVIELGGRLVVPGFNDAHVHFLSLGNALERVDLTGITGWEQMAQRVAGRVAEVEPGEPVIGRGWDQSLVPGSEWPTREVIDSVSPENPVILRRVDGHSALVNSFVLREKGITADTPDPEGGEIVRDPTTGEPTGVFKENAVGMVSGGYYESGGGEEANRRYLRSALELARRVGVTSIHEIAGIGNLSYYREAAENGELTVRVCYCPPLPDDPAVLDEYTGLRSEYDGHLIRFGFLKSFMDGTLGSSTAAMLAPYNDNPSTSGVLVQEPAELERKVLAADSAGFQVGVHAIGSRANRLVLDVYEKVAAANGVRDSRHRIEHSQILSPDDIPRFAELGVIASMQPSHCITDKRYAEDRLGRERCLGAYAWRSILASGGRIAFGTDAPVEVLNPMDNLYAATTRKDRAGEQGPGWMPREKLTMEEAIRLYTAGPAYASFEEDVKGTIEPGMLADMVVLSRNLFEIPEDLIQDTEVDFTVFDGRVVFER